MASFGQFSMDTLTAPRPARSRATPPATRRTRTPRTRSRRLGGQRDALAGQIRAALWNAEFGGQKIDEKQAKDWIKQANRSPRRRPRRSRGRSSRRPRTRRTLDKIKHIVVIYEENHSFDNLYGGWEGVNGLANADAAHTTQVNEAGNAYTCLKQNDVNLHGAVAARDDLLGLDAGNAGRPVHERTSRTQPFTIDDYIPPTDTTCPPNPLVASSPANGWLNGTRARPGGCTRDIVHRFYHEQYQLDGGKQDRYVTGSDAMGLTMGYYDTKALPIYQYLHSAGPPELRDRGRLLPVARSADRSSTTSG